ncbi:endonuclease III domain-containing protein [Halapricum desulfuricans]|uniref:EndoIII-related endonuclease n=1 Tax=Halapricum desulfuricans TaxID=2841257 RepID=A0A897N4S5_9EURY|nr:endonuclease III [Halapricum desulfuricans]QSG05336.1 EndoIII-related endonuclease [Halapricum desulfuricans]
MTDEPEENISGGATGGGRAATFETGDPATRAEAVVDRLGDLYWETTYGGQDAFETLVRTILSQNTTDTASQPAHDSLMERYGSGDLVENLAEADRKRLAETISSAGLYNQKSERIVAIAERVREIYGSETAFDEFVREGDVDAVRDSLLAYNGVGPKTADCVLLFSGGQDGVFPVDTHVHRIARRLGIAPPDADHETVRQHLEADVPDEKCGFGHTAMIQFGREYCTARKPACLDDPEACPMADLCDQVGVNPASGAAVDPAEAAESRDARSN